MLRFRASSTAICICACSFALRAFQRCARGRASGLAVRGYYGRPFITAPAIARNVYFSLAHTEGCVACVVSGHAAVGVDVEQIRERRALFATARSHFSQREIDALRVLQSRDVVDRFFDYWTLKEAYLKAKGIGMNLSLNQFSILISPNQKIGIRFAPGMADDPQRWHFMKSSPSARHRLAIAEGSGLANGLPIVVQSWPLARMLSVAR
jgi:4'-phosphopantetheinyl transferase